MSIHWSTLLVALAIACGSGGSERPPQGSPNGNGQPPPPPATGPTTPPPTPPPSPGGGTSGSTQCAGPPPGVGFECVRDCGPPVARAGDPEPGFSWLNAEQAANRKKFGCPICLPSDALIATPSGDVEISRLTPGAMIWSTSTSGQRIAKRIVHVVSSPAPNHHRIAAVELEDGRLLRASRGHPDADGRAIGGLAIGDALDGSHVRRITLLPYAGRTYDLVLEDRAVYYFANGVRVRSSLRPN